jgi:hypothetical protein
VDRLNIQTTCVIVWMTMRTEWGDVFRWHWWLFCILLHVGYDSWERNVKQLFWRPYRNQYNDTMPLRAVRLAVSSNYKFLSRYFCLKPKEEFFFIWGIHISQHVLCCSVWRLLFNEVRVLHIQMHYCKASHTVDSLTTFSVMIFLVYFVKYAQYIRMVEITAAFFTTNSYLRY